MQHAHRFDALVQMHDLLEDARQVGRGQVVRPA